MESNLNKKTFFVFKEEMAKNRFWDKRRRNLFWLIFGILLILVGMTGTSISLVSKGFASIWGIPPLVSFVLGVIFAYYGASEKW